MLSKKRRSKCLQILEEIVGGEIDRPPKIRSNNFWNRFINNLYSSFSVIQSYKDAKKGKHIMKYQYMLHSIVLPEEEKENPSLRTIEQLAEGYFWSKYGDDYSLFAYGELLSEDKYKEKKITKDIIWKFTELNILKLGVVNYIKSVYKSGLDDIQTIDGHKYTIARIILSDVSIGANVASMLMLQEQQEPYDGFNRCLKNMGRHIAYLGEQYIRSRIMLSEKSLNEILEEDLKEIPPYRTLVSKAKEYSQQKIKEIADKIASAEPPSKTVH